MKDSLYPNDILNIFKLFKKVGIRNFESSLPSLILDLVYGFIWEILYKSRKIAKYVGRIDITKNDIEIACRLELEYICFDPFKTKETLISSKILNSLFLKNKKAENYSHLDFNTRKGLKEDFKIKKKLH